MGSPDLSSRVVRSGSAASCATWRRASYACRRASSARVRAADSRPTRTTRPTANGTTTHADPGTSPAQFPDTAVCNSSADSATAAARVAGRTGSHAATV
jgi:hypothetical protein